MDARDVDGRRALPGRGVEAKCAGLEDVVCEVSPEEKVAAVRLLGWRPPA